MELQQVFLDVMTTIYSYFMELCKKTSGPPDANCSHKCKLTRNAFLTIPMILVDQHTLLRGSQLAYKGVWDNMKPYMFNIPRHLLHFEHFLKCLVLRKVQHHFNVRQS